MTYTVTYLHRHCDVVATAIENQMYCQAIVLRTGVIEHSGCAAENESSSQLLNDVLVIVVGTSILYALFFFFLAKNIECLMLL